MAVTPPPQQAPSAGALLELTISNLAIAGHVRLEPASGFNVLTGETGAGKSIIVDALTLLLGGKAGAGVVRAGADRAVVEGIFEAPPAGEQDELLAELGIGPAGTPGDGGPEDAADAGEAADPDDAGLILSREVTASGRSVCRINGRAVPSRTFTEVAQRMLDIHGQSEHLSLFRPREQTALLDRYAGLTGLRAEVATAVRELRTLRRELAALRGDERELARRMDLLAHQSEEIAAARLQPGEEEELRREHSRHANAERIAALAQEAYVLLAGPTGDHAGEGAGAQGDAAGAVDLVGRAVRALGALETLDPILGDLRRTVESAGFGLDEAAAGLRSYRDTIEHDPARMAEIDERMALIRDLQRKYSGTVEEVIAFGQQAGAELAACRGTGDRARDLEAREKQLVAGLGARAGRLSAERRRAAAGLVPAVERELAELGMPATRLAVRFDCTASAEGLPNAASLPATATVGAATGLEGREVQPAGTRAVRSAGAEPGRGTPVGESGAEPAPLLAFDENGVDRLELWISPNPGEPLRPLRTVASGGETSRIMLAIRTVLSAADPVPVLVFDEIDAGVGGRIGSVVGRKLAEIGRSHQVLAVTHLPQIAAFGDRHIRVAKQVEDGRTGTVVTTLDDPGRVDEIASMLGSTGEAARQTAADLLHEAASARQ